MLKKIVLGTLLVGLIGVLVAGAIVRTADRTGQVAEARGLEQGQGHGAGYGQGTGTDGQQNSRGGYGGEGREDAPGAGSGTGQAHAGEWLMLQGRVVSVDSDALVVQTDGGGEVIVEGRAWRFAQEQGFSAQVGDRVTLMGFDEAGDWQVGQIGNVASGQTVRLREENGRPLWAGGRGRRGG